MRVILSFLALAVLTSFAFAADSNDASKWNKLSPEEKKAGFELLFNGKNLDGWQGATNGYEAEDNMLVCKEGGNLYTAKEYENFIFRFNFRFGENANNGVGIRAPLKGDSAYQGMEIQILHDDGPAYKNLQPYQYHGSIYGVVPAKRGSLKELGEWNTEEIKCDGSHITITLNGNVIVDADIADIEETADHREHPGLHNPKGYIGFLGHGHRIEWNTIRVKELPSNEKK